MALRSWGRFSSVARARLSALVTESRDVSSISATSAARNPSTSRRISTARWRAGRSWSAVTKAKGDGLLGLVARLGVGRTTELVLDQHVRIGVEPERFGAPRRLGDRDVRRHLDLRSPPSRPEHVEGTVGRHRVEPRADRGSLLESPQAAPGREQRLLHRVLRVLQRPEDPVAVHVQLRPEGLDHLVERVLIAGLGPGDELRAHGPILPPPLDLLPGGVRPRSIR